MIPGVDSILSVTEAIVLRVLIHSTYRRRITGVAMLLSCFITMIYSLNPHNAFPEEPLLWLAWILLHGLSWFFVLLFLCLIATYFILKEDIISFMEEEKERTQLPDSGEEEMAEEKLSG